MVQIQCTLIVVCAALFQLPLQGVPIIAETLEGPNGILTFAIPAVKHSKSAKMVDQFLGQRHLLANILINTALIKIQARRCVWTHHKSTGTDARKAA